MRLTAAIVVLSVSLLRVELLSAQSSPRGQAPDKASIHTVVEQICSDGGQWLKCYSLEPSECTSITTSFVEPCVQKVSANASKDSKVHPVGQLLGCFNQEFMRKYGHGEVKTPECATPLKHLMGPGR